MNRPPQILADRHHLHRQHALGNELPGARPGHRRAQKAVGLGVDDQLRRG